MPVRFVRLTLMRREDNLILFLCCKWNSIPAVRLQPSVKLVLIQEPSSAWLGGGNGAVLQFHVHRTLGYVRVLDGLLHSHRLVAVLLCGFVTLCLLPWQHRSHAHHLIPKLGDDLREVVECYFFLFHKINGLGLETGGKGTEWCCADSDYFQSFIINQTNHQKRTGNSGNNRIKSIGLGKKKVGENWCTNINFRPLSR